MEWLPDLVTAGGAMVLPLCGPTARRLLAALVKGRGSCADRDLLAAALSRDAALALWTIAAAHQDGRDDLRTIDAVADWLSRSALELWSHREDAAQAELRANDKSRAGGTAPEWDTLAARSLIAAQLAGEAAHRHESHPLDPRTAHLVGLLHLAPQWIAAGSDDQLLPTAVLPPWLLDELERIANAAPTDDAAVSYPSLTDCVHLARRLAEADSPLEQASAERWPVDASLVDAVAEVREDWRCEGEGAPVFGLAAKLRRLSELEHDFQRVLETEKLESLKQLAYGAGHEINNPLANISARAQALLPGELDPQRRRMLASINTQAFRAHEMIADMMLFARPPGARADAFDVAELLAQLHSELVERAAEQQTELVWRAPRASRVVVGDATQIAVAVRSLCVNALEAVVIGGRVELALAETDRPDGGVQITVADDGPGIPPEVRGHIFDPFYSGREAGRGLGLGLSKCWRIVTQHRGRVDVDSPGGRGAVFTVTLPGGNGR